MELAVPTQVEAGVGARYPIKQPNPVILECLVTQILFKRVVARAHPLSGG